MIGSGGVVLSRLGHKHNSAACSLSCLLIPSEASCHVVSCPKEGGSVWQGTAGGLWQQGTEFLTPSACEEWNSADNLLSESGSEFTRMKNGCSPARARGQFYERY